MVDRSVLSARHLWLTYRSDQVMIRPRVGDFLYSKEELVVMLEDIRTIKELGGVRGFVVGALTKDGSIDVECMKRCRRRNLFASSFLTYFSLVDEILPLESE